MKKVLSLILAFVIVVSAFSCSTISASAAGGVTFGQENTHYYSYSNDCMGTLVVPSNGVVTLNVTLPRTEYGSERSIDLYFYKGATKVIDGEGLYEDGTYYLFLTAGTYTYNFQTYSYDYLVTPIKYKFTFQTSYNNLVRPISFGTTYSYIYNTYDCYNSFSLSQDSTVTFTMTQPLDYKGQAEYAYLYVYDMNNAGKQIWYSTHKDTESYNYSVSVRLAKGNYKFNIKSYAYGTQYFAEPNDILTASYKVTATPATAPKAPFITQTVETTKYSTYTTYDVSASFKDDLAYDGVELWTKTNDGAWVLDDSATNSEYSRHTKVSIYVSSSSHYVVYYKVRAYSMYGANKKYSAFSNILYTKTSLKPSKPTVYATGLKKAAKISWYESSDVDGYVIYRSTKQKKGYKKVATVNDGSKKSFKNKKLKRRKTYYYKVRAYKIIDNVKIYSSYSTPIKVKTK